MLFDSGRKMLKLDFTWALSLWICALPLQAQQAAETAPTPEATAASADSPHAAARSAALAQLPYFSSLISSDFDRWQPLSANALEALQAKQALLLVLSTPRGINAQLDQRISRALAATEVRERLEGVGTALASPAWWWVFEQRMFFASSADQARRGGVPCGQVPLHLLRFDGEVVGFQAPGYRNYEAKELDQLLEVYLDRNRRDPNVSGFYSAQARKAQDEQLLGTERAVPSGVAGLAPLAGSLQARANESAASDPGPLALLMLSLSESHALGEGLAVNLQTSSRKLLDLSWQQLEKSSSGLLVADVLGEGPASSAVLGVQCLFLLSEARLAKFSEADPTRAARARAFLGKVESQFVGAAGLPSSQVSLLGDGKADPQNWVLLDDLAIYAMARLAWQEPGASLDWLEEIYQKVAADEGLPHSLLPAAPEDPPSVRGVALLGELCLRAAAQDEGQRQLWQDRSVALFQRLDSELSADQRGYRTLPENHPLAPPPETIFSDFRHPAPVEVLGLWLRGLAAMGNQQAEQRRQELAEGYAAWSARQPQPTQAMLFARGIELLEVDKGQVDAPAKTARP